MKLSLTLILTLTLTAAAFAQTPANEFVAAGPAYQAAAAPHVTGWAVYAKQIAPETSPGTYSFTEYDVLAKTLKPFVLDSAVRTGLMQQVFQWSPATLSLCVDAGPSVSGSGAGGSFGACGMGRVQIGKTKWFLVGIVAGVKASLSDPTVVYKFGIGRTR